MKLDDRVTDIYERHELEDGVYQDAVEIVSYLRERGYEDIEQKVLEHFCLEHKIETELNCSE